MRVRTFLEAGSGFDRRPDLYVRYGRYERYISRRGGVPYLFRALVAEAASALPERQLPRNRPLSPRQVCGTQVGNERAMPKAAALFGDRASWSHEWTTTMTTTTPKINRILEMW